MRTLVVTFPGFGYLAVRPLLYYAKKMAAQYGYDVLDVEYSALAEGESVKERAEKSLGQAVLDARQQINAACAEKKYEKVICVSKSFGTLVAGSLWKELSEKAEAVQIFLTPLPETYTMFMQGKCCIAATGTADPFMTGEGIRQMEEDAAVELLLFERANHSLENPEDTVESVRNLERIAACYERVYGR